MSFFGRRYHGLLLGDSRTAGVAGGRFLDAHAWVPQILPLRPPHPTTVLPFSFIIDVALYRFPIINHCHEDDHILSPERPLG